MFYLSCRNPKYKIITTAALSGSVISAYDDVKIGDPDFDSIQGNSQSFIEFVYFY